MDASDAKYWVVGITEAYELIKWGKDGDVIYPFDMYMEALDQIDYLRDSGQEANYQFYILAVFPNGQMKTYEPD